MEHKFLFFDVPNSERRKNLNFSLNTRTPKKFPRREVIFRFILFWSYL